MPVPIMCYKKVFWMMLRAYLQCMLALRFPLAPLDLDLAHFLQLLVDFQLQLQEKVGMQVTRTEP